MREPDIQSKEGTEGEVNSTGRHVSIFMEDNPQLLKILADNQSKKQQIIHWSIFFFVTFATFVVVNFLPHPITYFKETDNFCTNPIEVDNSTGEVTCQPFNLYQRSEKGLAVRGITTLNQFVALNAYFYIKNTDLDIDYSTKANVTLYELESDSAGKWYAKSLATKSVEYSLATGKSTKFFSDEGRFLGYDVELFYVRTIKFSNYLFIVSFPTQAEAVSNLDNLKVEASVISKQFSLFSIILRLIFFAVALAAFVFYIRNLRRISRRSYVLEQKFTLVLGLQLVLFNDPFYAITISIPNDASNFFSVLFVVMLICTLLFFWICALERVEKENGEAASHVITKVKFALFALGCLSILGYYLYFSYRHNSDPFVDLSELSSGLFYFLLVSSVLFVGVALIKIIISFINICKDYDAKIWRNKLFTNFSIFFVFCVFIFLFSNGFEVFSVLPNRILIIFVQVNMYVLYLMFMYSPSKDANELQMGYTGFQAESYVDEELKTVVHISMIGKEDELEEDYAFDNHEINENEVEYPLEIANGDSPREQQRNKSNLHDSKSLLENTEPMPQERRYSLTPSLRQPLPLVIDYAPDPHGNGILVMGNEMLVLEEPPANPIHNNELLSEQQPPEDLLQEAPVPEPPLPPSNNVPDVPVIQPFQEPEQEKSFELE